MRQKRIRARGFTLIEMLAALLVLSLLGLMSYRGLGAVLDARDHLKAEAERWQRVQSFFLRFERDLRLAAPRPVASGAGTAAAWLGQTGSRQEPELQLTRFTYDGGADTARRVGYRRNENQEIELWLWPGLDVAPGAVPARYPVLAGVREFELQYLNSSRAWENTWPVLPKDPPIPLAVRLRVVLGSGEELVRVFALNS